MNWKEHIDDWMTDRSWKELSPAQKSEAQAAGWDREAYERERALRANLREELAVNAVPAEELAQSLLSDYRRQYSSRARPWSIPLWQAAAIWVLTLAAALWGLTRPPVIEHRDKVVTRIVRDTILREVPVEVPRIIYREVIREVEVPVEAPEGEPVAAVAQDSSVLPKEAAAPADPHATVPTRLGWERFFSTTIVQ